MEPTEAARRYRVAVIGCGTFGTRHLEALSEMVDRVEVVVVADPHVEAAKAAADRFGIPRFVTDHRDAFDGVDAVALATPHDLHFPIARDALAAGLHVFVEKPLAMSEPEGLQLVTAAAESGKTFMVGYPLRYHPLLVGLKRELDGGAWGDPIHVSLVTEMYLEVPPGHWRGTAASRGGGALFSHGCHYIDLLLWLLGEPVRGAHLGTGYGTGWEVAGETTGHAVIEFAQGAIGHHFSTEVANQDDGYSLFQVHCTNGTLLAHHREGRLEGRRRGEGSRTLLQTTPKHKFLDAEFSHFFDCVGSGTRPLTDAARSLQSLRVIWRLYEAERTGSGYADLRGLGLAQGMRS